ncbi:MAG: DUF4340 domain-containing protein [Ruminococcaceae bacterium]|nr:DUF4340 domain-containing protein [Oscillospiraceae bacterium]
MNKRTKSALILGISALVLLLVFLGVKLIKNAAAKGEEAPESVTLLSLPADKIEKLTLTYGGETLTFAPDAEGVWWVEEYPGLKIDQSYPESMVSAAENLVALRELGTVENKGEYGLEPAECTLVYRADGVDYPMAIGSANGPQNNYYLSPDGERVYLVDSAIGNAAKHSLFVMAEKDTIPVFSRNLWLTTPDTKIEWVEGGKDFVYTPEYEWFLTDQTHTDLVVGEEQVNELFAKVSSLRWTDLVDYKPDDAELIQYGLGSSAYPVELGYIHAETDEEGETTETEETFQITFGRSLTGENGESLVYATCGDSGLVYTLDAAVADAFRKLDPLSLRPTDVLRMDWTTVDQIEVTAGDLAREIDISYTLKENEDGEKVEVYAFHEDEVELDDTLTETFIDYLSYMEADGTVEGIGELAEPEITVVFHRNTGDEFAEMTFSIHPYDQSFSVVSFNGESRILVNKNHVGELLLHFENIR